MSKISIRFYNDREVRAIWDEEKSKWWFSVLDVIGAINAQDDYQKTRNYWKYLKTKLKKDKDEVVSATNQLKLIAPDAKSRQLTRNSFWFVKRARLKREFEIYREREMRHSLSGSICCMLPSTLCIPR
jgi:hypothetical protein